MRVTVVNSESRTARNPFSNVGTGIPPRLSGNEISALNAGTVGLGGRFLKLEKELQAMTAQLDELRAQAQRNTPYTQAIHLAQRGHDVKSIMDICGVAYNEAQLIVMMHANQHAA